MTETLPAATAPTLAVSANAPENLKRNNLVISLMLVATFVVFLNETIIGVALPRVMTSLNIDASTGQWLSTAFMLTMAVVIPITGFLIQRLNTRTIFVLAMSLFSLGTLTAALAPGFEVLLVGRIVQASGTAIMMPLLMTTVMQLVPPTSRGKTMGYISIVMSVAPAVGPTVAGLILSVFAWPVMFWLVLPIALGALVLGALRVKNVTVPTNASVDALSIILSAFGFAGLVYGLSSLGESAAGHATAPVWIPLTVGVVALTLFVLRQLSLQKQNRALLDLRTFTAPGYTISISLMAVMTIALFGVIILLPIYMQRVLYFEPLAVGLLLLPGGLVMGLLGPVVGRLYDRFGPRPLAVPGAAAVSLALWTMTFFNEHTTFVMLLVTNLVMYAGFAFMFTPLFTSSLGSLKPHLYSHGSATLATIQQVAGAAGTALFVALYTVQSVALSASGAPTQLALAGGVHVAFVCGAIISLFGVAGAFFVPKPVSEFGGAVHAGTDR